MPEDLRRTPRGRLDEAIDTVLGEMVRLDPPASLLSAVTSRLDEDSASSGRLRAASLLGGWSRWMPAAGLAAAGVVAVVAYLTWPTPAPGPAPAAEATMASRARATGPSEGPAASAAAGTTTEIGGGSVTPGSVGTTRSTRTAPIRAGAAAASESLADAASSDSAGAGAVGGLSAMIADPDEEGAVPRLVVSARPAPAAIAIAPVAFHDLVIEELRIPPIEVAPIDPGGQPSTTREPPRRERQ